MAVTFRVLGAVGVERDGTPIALSGKPLALLACLLLRANTAVSVDALTAVLWDDARAHGKGAVQTYVTRLRRALGRDVVRTQAGGYRVDVGPDGLDLLQFQELTDQGNAAAATGDHETAAVRFEAALALWRGPALSNVDSDVLHREDVAALSERQLAVWQRWVDAQLALGQTPIAELTRLTGEHPLHEPFWEQLMLALHRSGRTADALSAYQRVSRIVADELGLDPSSSLQRVHRAILTGTLDEPARREAPRQLAATIGVLTGRVDELAQLAKLPAMVSDDSSVIAVIEGTAGVGKTTLAVRAAHDIVEQFPGGQVQLNLRGYGPGEPVPPAAALEWALAAVGVAGGEIPADLDARAALWRSRTSGRRMLILLDNARSSEQVRPLLPGPGCLALITSRAQLPGLTAREAAVRVSLNRLGEADAVDLLARTIGSNRVHADPDSARRFVARCANLPLAIRILGEHANSHPSRSLADLVDDIDAESDQFAYFDLHDGEDTDLRAIFSGSYHALDDEAAHVFRLLGVHPGHDFDVLAAAALVGSPVGSTQRLIDRLAGANLLERHRPGRYEFHDLLREFAATLVRPDVQPALERLLDWYLHSVIRADNLIMPGWTDWFIDDLPPADGFQLPELADRTAAMDWYATEHDNLIALVDMAQVRGFHRKAGQLAVLLRPHFAEVPIRDGWIATHEAALRSAKTIGDRRTEGQLLCGLGLAHVRFGAAELGVAHCEAALEIARQQDEPTDEMSALNNLAIAWWELSEFERAIDIQGQALAVAQRTGDARRVAVARTNLAGLYLVVGRFQDALEQAQAALDGYGYPGSTRSTALVQVGAAYAGLGDYETSLPYYRDALERFRAYGVVIWEIETLERLGDLHVEIGEPVVARRYYLEALELVERVGLRTADRLREKSDSVAARYPAGSSS